MLSENINLWAPPESFMCFIFGVVVVITMVSIAVFSCVGHGGGKRKIRSRWEEVRYVYVRGGATKQKKQSRNAHRDAWFVPGGVADGVALADTTVLVTEAATSTSGGCSGGYGGGCGGGRCGGGGCGCGGGGGCGSGN